MDILLLGAAAVVLIAITVWIVWPSPTQAGARGTGLASQQTGMMPLGDEFEDQYTSATADLSGGGVATAMTTEPPATEAAVAPPPTPIPAPSERRWSPPAAAEPVSVVEPSGSRMVSARVAAALTLGGALAGAGLYALWDRRRNRPANRLKRSVTKW
jgi:hypothetical protein